VRSSLGLLLRTYASQALLRPQDEAELFALRVLKAVDLDFHFDEVKKNPKSSTFDISMLRAGHETGVCQVKSSTNDAAEEFQQAQRKHDLFKIPLSWGSGHWLIQVKTKTQLATARDDLRNFVLLLERQGITQWPLSKNISQLDAVVAHFALRFGITSALKGQGEAGNIAIIMPEAKFDSWTPQTLELNEWIGSVLVKHKSSFETIEAQQNRQKHLFIATGSGTPLPIQMEAAIDPTAVPTDIPMTPEWLDYLWVGLSHLSNEKASQVFLFERDSGWKRLTLKHS
jgi:hypothetical protein